MKRLIEILVNESVNRRGFDSFMAGVSKSIRLTPGNTEIRLGSLHDDVSAIRSDWEKVGRGVMFGVRALEEDTGLSAIDQVKRRERILEVFRKGRGNVNGR